LGNIVKEYLIKLQSRNNSDPVNNPILMYSRSLLKLVPKPS
jgi:hypothetical protein